MPDYRMTVRFARDSGHVRNKAIYLAIGVTLDGLKEVLGLWIAQTEGAKFWLQVVTTSSLLAAYSRQNY